MWCNYIEYEGMWVSRETYHQIMEHENEKVPYSSGYPDSHITCQLLGLYRDLGQDKEILDSVLEDITKEDRSFKPDFEILK